MNEIKNSITLTGNFDVRFTESGLELHPIGTGTRPNTDGNQGNRDWGWPGPSGGGRRADVPVPDPPYHYGNPNFWVYAEHFNQEWKERRLQYRMQGILGRILNITFEQIRKTSKTSDCFKKGSV